MAESAGGGRRLPEDLVIWEILMRLPTKPLLRCRAVCRSWRRRLTSDAKFLLAHHRRQPSLQLLTEVGRSTEERRIDALDHLTGERRPVARMTGRGQTAAGAAEHLHLDVLGSCDGLLVLSANGRVEICNPATRQRAPLTLLQGAAFILALYHHRPSESYRVLCCFKSADDGGGRRAVYRVCTVGSGELRCVGEPPAPWASADLVLPMILMVHCHCQPPVVADGRIYWPAPVDLPDGNIKINNILAFDTMAESFQQLLLPVDGTFELFQMNSGGLGMYHYHGGTADLWALQDHGSWSWSMNHRIKLPGLLVSFPVPSAASEGDVFVVSDNRRSGIRGHHLQHISGANGRLLARYEWSVNLKLSRHWLKESLVRHDFFPMEGNAGGVDAKPLFDGLSTVSLLRDDNSEPS